MANNKNPTGQHDLPKTYLKRFSINPDVRRLKSLVYCYWTDEFGVKTKETSIDAKKFKIDDFYTINHDTEPYAFEYFFRDQIEPLYNDIMLEMEGEKNLSSECRQHLIQWLYYNKYRNRTNRNSLEDSVSFLIEAMYSMQHGKEKFENQRQKVKEIAASNAKEIQLKSFLMENLLIEFEKGMGTKHWMILKSRQKNLFFTNDNPGFSINTERLNYGFKLLLKVELKQ